MITVNGKELALPVRTTLGAYLAERGYDPSRVAVEKNGVVVARAALAAEPLGDGDTLEVVGFVGGG